MSVDSAEDQADVFVVPGGEVAGSFAPSISDDGQVVAFASNAADLVPGDTNAASDVFVRDRAPRPTAEQELVALRSRVTGFALPRGVTRAVA